MPRGLPDYYNPSTVVSQRVVDMTQILATLAGISPVDGRGRILYFDSFKDGLVGWTLANIGDGVIPVAYVNLSELPPVSARLDGGTLAGNGQSIMNRVGNVLDATGLGFEAGLYFSSFDTVTNLNIYYHGASRILAANLQLISATGVCQIVTGGVLTPIVTLGNLAAADGWIPVKLVADVANGVYSRLIVGQSQYDLTQALQDTGPSTVQGRIQVNLSVQGKSGTAGVNYLGHVFITTDEP